VGATERIIAGTARPRTTTQGCGGDGPGDVPNNVYGWGIVDALAAVQASQVSKGAVFPMGIPVRSLVYTLTFANIFDFTLTQVVLTDAIPVGTTFAWASGDYTQAGGVVTWTAADLASQENGFSGGGSCSLAGCASSHLAGGSIGRGRRWLIWRVCA
jgi:uncharacterized repeat protein (TIGR01451 family)